MATTVEQIKERLSIVEVVSGYVQLQRAGITFKARCPFHSEKTPSFVVSPDRGTFHCFGCNKGGDMFTFVQDIEGIDFKGALKMLADKAGVEVVYERGNGKEEKDARDRLYELLEAATIYFQRNLTEGTPPYEYLMTRGLTAQTVQTFRLGWVPDDWRLLTSYLRGKGYSEADVVAAGLAKYPEDKGVRDTSKAAYDRFRSRVMFPIGDTVGRVVGFSGRIFEAVPKPASAESGAKYINSPETELFHKAKILYGYDKAKQHIRKLDCTVLVEGQMDLCLSHQAGWGNTVAVSGTALTTDHLTLLKRMSNNLVLALDADDAGVAAATKSARLALQAGMDVKVAVVPHGKDPADLIRDHGADAWKECIKNAVPIVTFLLDVHEKRAKDTHGLLKIVEKEVIPFVVDMPSPLDRDFFIADIAKRTGVQESTLRQVLSTVKNGGVMKSPPKPSIASGVSAPRKNPTEIPAGRIQHAYGLLLSQESSRTPTIDTAAFREKLRHALGDDMFTTLEAIAPEEKERLRFVAEALYAPKHISTEADALIRALLRERLIKELTDTSKALKQAETMGDEEEVARLLRQSKLLTGDIAKLDEVR